MNQKRILLIGAGRSTYSLVSYLLEKSETEDFKLVIADISLESAKIKSRNHKNALPVEFDVNNQSQREKLISESNVVISMLPVNLHLEVIKDCIRLKRHLVTASYVSKELKALQQEAIDAGVVIINEVGVDPGIDHMSAKKIIDGIKDKGGKMLFFESFTGGLIAPESDTTLWNYKFTWNPRNVVVAGQGGAAKFIHNGQYKYIPYQKLFRRTEFIEIPGHGRFEAYANRDSLAYRDAYGLHDIPTLFRGTFRRVGFSRAWNIFVELGLTDDSYVMENTEEMSYRDFINTFLPYHPYNSVEIKLRHYLKIDQDDIVWDKLMCLDIFNPNKKVGLKDATPAQILQKILMDKWKFVEGDRDMIIMYHKFGYELDGKKWQTNSYMVSYGLDDNNTAMARTVGLPTAITAYKVLKGQISTPGVHIPIDKEFYNPVLDELKNHGIEFKEMTFEYTKYHSETNVD